MKIKSSIKTIQHLSAIPKVLSSHIDQLYRGQNCKMKKNQYSSKKFKRRMPIPQKLRIIAMVSSKIKECSH